jgi:hypothetical protein
MNLQSQLRNWERHQSFEKWQAAQLMILLFGEKILQRIPPLPAEYTSYGNIWLEQQKELVKKSKQVADAS